MQIYFRSRLCTWEKAYDICPSEPDWFCLTWWSLLPFISLCAICLLSENWFFLLYFIHLSFYLFIETREFRPVTISYLDNNCLKSLSSNSVISVICFLASVYNDYILFWSWVTIFYSLTGLASLKIGCCHCESLLKARYADFLLADQLLLLSFDRAGLKYSFLLDHFSPTAKVCLLENLQTEHPTPAVH
jgi:hypothetical protein